MYITSIIHCDRLLTSPFEEFDSVEWNTFEINRKLFACLVFVWIGIGCFVYSNFETKLTTIYLIEIFLCIHVNYMQTKVLPNDKSIKVNKAENIVLRSYVCTVYLKTFGTNSSVVVNAVDFFYWDKKLSQETQTENWVLLQINLTTDGGSHIHTHEKQIFI